MAALRPAVPAIAALLAVIFVFALPRPERPLTTYAAASDVAASAGALAGVALIAAGAVIVLLGRAARLGVIAMLAGFVWWAPDVVGWEGGPPLARSVAELAAPLYLPLLAHLVLAFPSGRLRAWPLVAAAYAVGAGVSLGRALFREPFADVYCWRNCTDNVFLVSSHQDLVETLERIGLIAVVVVGLGLSAIAIGRPGAVARARAAVAAAIAVGVAEATYAAALLIEPAEDPSRAGFAAIYVGRAAAAAALATVLVSAVVEARRRHAAVARLATDLGEAPAPGTLGPVLARTLGDPGLRVGYWVPAQQRHVDVEGRGLEPAAPGQAVTRIARGGEDVAVVVHDAALLDGRGLEDEIGAAARLAVDNERLQAAVLAQVADLRASRARVVERADAERRRLERDLHDGAQQRLLALSYELRLARAAAGDAELEAALNTAIEDAGDALAELRGLAHGIYPAVLAESGLAPALATLADTAPLPVVLGEVTGERLPEPVEATAYVAVASAVETASAESVEVSAVVAGDRLVVRVFGSGGAAQHVADRVGALGGRLEAGPDALAVELPRRLSRSP